MKKNVVAALLRIVLPVRNSCKSSAPLAINSSNSNEFIDWMIRNRPRMMDLFSGSESDRKIFDVSNVL